MKSKGLIFIFSLSLTWFRNNYLKSSPFHFEDCLIFLDHYMNEKHLPHSSSFLSNLSYSGTAHFPSQLPQLLLQLIVLIKLCYLFPDSCAWTWFFLLPKPLRMVFHGFPYPSRINLALASLKNTMPINLVYTEAISDFRITEFRNERRVHELPATILLLGRYGNKAMSNVSWTYIL